VSAISSRRPQRQRTFGLREVLSAARRNSVHISHRQRNRR